MTSLGRNSLLRCPDPGQCESFGYPGLVRECGSCPGWSDCLRTFNKHKTPFGLLPVQRTVDVSSDVEEVEHDHFALETAGRISDEAVLDELIHVLGMLGLGSRGTRDEGLLSWRMRRFYDGRMHVIEVVRIDYATKREVRVLFPQIDEPLPGMEQGIVNGVERCFLSFTPGEDGYDTFRKAVQQCVRKQRGPWKVRHRTLP